MKNQHVLLAILAILLFSFCKNDDDLSPQNPTVDIDRGELITTTITGVVYSGLGSPVKSAIVTLGNNSTMTDINGFFIFKNVQTRSRDTYLVFEKEGLIHNSRRLYPRANTITNIVVNMSTSPRESFDSDQGGVVEFFWNEVKVEFPPNALVYKNGDAYTGEAMVRCQFYDPESDDFYAQVPGDLSGIDTEGNLRALASYGMTNITIFSSGTGTIEELQLAPDKKATITFPLSSNLAGSAPETIPLWHFDEEAGYWVEEGSASLQGNTYVGEVSHFSFWNCDDPYTLVYLNGRLVDENNAPLKNRFIKVTLGSNGNVGGGQTDSDGYFAGLFPMDELLTFELYTMPFYCDQESSEAYWNEEFGPYNTDTDLGENVVVVNMNGFEESYVSGTLLNCMGQPLENGYVKFDFANYRSEAFYVEGGAFSVTFDQCLLENFTVSGYDLDELRSSDAYNYQYTENLVLDPIMVCEDYLDEFITWKKVGSTSHLHINPNFHRNHNSSVIQGNDQGVSKIMLAFEGTSIGEFPTVTTSFPDDNDITVTTSTYDSEGGYIEGTFEGHVVSDFEEYDIEGSFRIKNNFPDPSIVNCTLPSTSFTGTYTLEVVEGGNSCLTNGSIYELGDVELTYLSEFERTVDLVYIPDLQGAELDITIPFLFSCEDVYIPLTSLSYGCVSTSIYHQGGFPLETYDINDDSEMQFRVTDFVFGECGCPPSPDNVFRLVKQ